MARKMESFKEWQDRVAREGTVFVGITPGWRDKLGIARDDITGDSSSSAVAAPNAKPIRAKKVREPSAKEKKKLEKERAVATARADEAAAALVAEIEAENAVAEPSKKSKNKKNKNKNKSGGAAAPVEEKVAAPAPAKQQKKSAAIPKAATKQAPSKPKAAVPLDKRCMFELDDESSAPFTDCAVDNEGSRLVLASEDGSLELWSTVQTVLSKIATLHATRDEAVCACAVGSDGTSIASGSVDGTLQLWDSDSASCTLTVEQAHMSPVTCCAFSPHGAMLATASLDGNVRLWVLPDGQSILSMSSHSSAPVRSCVFSPCGEMVASCGDDGRVSVSLVFNGETEQCLQALPGTRLNHVCYANDGQLIVAVGSNAQAWMWPASGSSSEQTTRHATRLPCPKASSDCNFNKCSVLKDGAVLGACATDGSLWLWAIGTAKHLLTIQADNVSVDSCCLVPGSPRMASVADGVLRVWDVSQAFQQASTRIAVQSNAKPKARHQPKQWKPVVCDDTSTTEWKGNNFNLIADLYKERARVSGLVAEFDNMSLQVMQHSQAAEAAVKSEFKQLGQSSKGQSSSSSPQNALMQQLAADIQKALENPNTSSDVLHGLLRSSNGYLSSVSGSQTNSGARVLSDAASMVTNSSRKQSNKQKGQAEQQARRSNTRVNNEWAPGSQQSKAQYSRAAQASQGPPEAPPEFEARGNGSHSLKLAWVPPSSSSAITAYEVRQLVDEQWSTVYQDDHVNTSLTVQGLNSATRYCFGVRALNSNGPGPWKNCVGTTATPMHYSPIPSKLGRDFGREGLLYWVGTQEGTEREWSNPCLTGDVNITVSSKDGGAVNNALARVPSKLCTEDIDGSWIAVRLLKHRITVHGYALQLSLPCGDMAKGNCYAPRSWVLEASDDGIQWQLMHDHRNDNSLSLDKPMALWKVTSTDHAFSQIRIRMTGPNARKTEGGRFRLALAGLELYGIVVANTKA